MPGTLGVLGDSTIEGYTDFAKVMPSLFDENLFI
jgi:hypothetical protein